MAPFLFDEITDEWRYQLKERGYFKIPSRYINPVLISKLDTLLKDTVERGQSPHEIMMHDEPWELNRLISPVLNEVTMGLVPRHEWLAFYRHSSYLKGGFSDAHRDLPDADASSFIDGMPQYVTVWVSLSHATPESSCLYFLPACDDPSYLDPTRKTVLQSEAQLPCIVCEPAEPGDVFVFSHRVVHWGSKPREGAAPRTTLTWTMTNPAFLTPHLSTKYKTPCLETRRALICATAIALEGRERLTDAQWREYIPVFYRNKHVFTEEFAKDVRDKISNYKFMLKGANGQQQLKQVPRQNQGVAFDETFVGALSDWEVV